MLQVAKYVLLLQYIEYESFRPFLQTSNYYRYV
ncbi:hypothetical protein UVUMRFZT_CDS0081 [Staphylococcus phage LJLAME001]